MISANLVFSSILHCYKFQLNTALENHLNTQQSKKICKKIKTDQTKSLSSWTSSTGRWQGWWSVGEDDTKSLGLPDGQPDSSHILQPLVHTFNCPEPQYVTQPQSSAFPPWHTLFHYDWPRSHCVFQREIRDNIKDGYFPFACNSCV